MATNNQVIAKALRLIGVLDEIESVSAEQGASGLQAMNDMLMALRADHWLHIHPEASDELKQSIKAQIFAAFYTDTDVWREQIISQAREAMFQAIEGLK